jgi:hypothetical protein
VLFAEITRILNHLLNICAFGLDLGAITPFLWGFEERERLMEFYERASGARLHANYFRPGGVHMDLPPRLADDILWLLRDLPEDDRRYRASADRQPHLPPAHRRYRRHQRRGRGGLGNVGPDAARLGRGLGSAQGAALRRLRRDRFRRADRQERRLLRPLSGADRGDAPIVRIIRRPRKDAAGPVKVNDRKVAPPPRAEMKQSMEALIHHFKLYTEGYHVPAGETYTAVEAPKGEFGVYLVADGTNRPYRCKIRAPGFAFLQATEFMCRATCWPISSRSSARWTSCSARSTDEPADGIDGPPFEQPASFEFTPENLEKAKYHIAKYPPGRQASAVLPLLDLAQRQHDNWLPQGGDGQGRRDARHGADPRLRGRDLLHDVQPAAGRALVSAGLHDDAVLAARLGRGRRRLQEEARHRVGAPPPTAVHAGRGRMPRRLRQRADPPGQRRFLRGYRRASTEKLLDALPPASRRRSAR